MKRTLHTFVIALAMVMTLGLTSQAMALPSASQVSVYNTIYGTSKTMASLDALLLPFDDVWVEFNGGAAVEAKFAGFTQTLGIYTDLGIGNVQTVLFGPISTGGFLTGITASFDPNVPFGWFTDPSGSGPFFSENFTDGGFDHFRTYTTPIAGELLVMTEDLPGGGDNDFVDLVFSVTNAAPIPEPGTFLLMGTGLIGLIGYSWRKRKQEAVSNDS